MLVHLGLLDLGVLDVLFESDYCSLKNHNYLIKVKNRITVGVFGWYLVSAYKSKKRVWIDPKFGINIIM